MGLVEPLIHKPPQLETLHPFKHNLLGKHKRFRSRCLTFKEKDKSRFAKLDLPAKIG
jgi:hypothetical protein